MVWLIKKYKELVRSIAQTRDEVDRARSVCEQGKNYLEEALKIQEATEKIKQEVTQGFPWLANAYADYSYLRDEQRIYCLQNKERPALTAAAEQSRIAKEKRELTRALKQSQYILNYYESLFPWLQDYIDIDPEEVKVQNTEVNVEDEVARFISKQEYHRLPTAERNQLALDRYINTSHSKKHVGKMYERYIGYLYEQRGYTVEYKGILDGFDDLGRDLVCRGRNAIYVVQCKCWAANKLIREAHINQLYGTYIKFKIEESKKAASKIISGLPIYPVFVTSTELSDTAKEFADALKIQIIKIAISKQYPMIKCNVSGSEKIYHLPFDQQYDRTQIKKPGERYATTIKEVESLGFRRAKRWQGNN